MQPPGEPLGRILGEYMVRHVDDLDRRQELVDTATNAQDDMVRVWNVLRSLRHDPDAHAAKSYHFRHEYPHLRLPMPPGFSEGEPCPTCGEFPDAH